MRRPPMSTDTVDMGDIPMATPPASKQGTRSKQFVGRRQPRR